jgi:hypothetical protein
MVIMCIFIFFNLWERTLFGKSTFILDTCFSDYLYCNWYNPRYSIVFWENFFIANEVYGFSYNFDAL